LAKGKVRWTFAEHTPTEIKERKREPISDEKPLSIASFWRHPAPFIHKDLVVFTAPENPFIWCVNLKDGTRRWRAENHDDVYLAGIFGDIVLLVGKKHCRALSLKTGAQKWQLETGIPSGLGAVRDGLYYLPLHRGIPSGKAEICILDV